MNAVCFAGTFKHQKVKLREQGCVPSKTVSEGNTSPDPLWKCVLARLLAADLLHHTCRISEADKTYKPFKQADYEQLSKLQSKL